MGTDQAQTTGYAPKGKDSGVVKSKGTARLPIADGRAIPLRRPKPEWLKVPRPGGPN